MADEGYLASQIMRVAVYFPHSASVRRNHLGVYASKLLYQSLVQSRVYNSLLVQGSYICTSLVPRPKTPSLGPGNEATSTSCKIIDRSHKRERVLAAEYITESCSLVPRPCGRRKDASPPRSLGTRLGIQCQQ